MKRVFQAGVLGVFLLALATVQFGLSPAPAEAAGLPKCSISIWNTRSGESGGCTCWVAERIRATRNMQVPNWGDASQWYSRASWPEDSQLPRAGAIAAYGGHVAYVESVSRTNSREDVTRTTQKVVGYSMRNGRLVPTLLVTRDVKVTETYRVSASQRDYPRILRGDNSVRYTDWTAVRTYNTTTTALYINNSLVGQSRSSPQNVQWQTPRNGWANGLMGYIYTP